MNTALRVGIGTDIHRLVEGRPLCLGTVVVPSSRGLAGHSDGDVLCHAVADALLGAAALGEIGSLFPDDDPKWEGISGADLLGRVAALVTGAGWVLVHVDCVVQAERPRLAPHRAAMAEGIARALGVEGTRASVKIKSAEGLGAIGRGEGISAVAVALISARTDDPPARPQA